MSLLDGLFTGAPALKWSPKLVAGDATIAIGLAHRVAMPLDGCVLTFASPVGASDREGKRFGVKMLTANVGVSGVVELVAPDGQYIEADDGNMGASVELTTDLGDYREWMCAGDEWLLVALPPLAGGGDEGEGSPVDTEARAAAAAAQADADTAVTAAAAAQATASSAATAASTAQAAAVAAAAAAATALGLAGTAGVPYRSSASYTANAGSIALPGLSAIPIAAAGWYRFEAFGICAPPASGDVLAVWFDTANGGDLDATVDRIAMLSSAERNNIPATTEKTTAAQDMSNSSGSGDYMRVGFTSTQPHVVRMQWQAKFLQATTVSIKVQGGGGAAVVVRAGFTVVVSKG